MAYSLDVSHLLALPFESGADPSSGRADCGMLARAVLRLNGREEAADMIPQNPTEAIRIAKRMRDGEISNWCNVGSSPSDATELGDILQGPGTDGSLHVEILVSTQPRLVLTTFLGRYSCLRRPEKFTSCTAVLRSSL